MMNIIVPQCLPFITLFTKDGPYSLNRRWGVHTKCKNNEVNEHMEF